MSIKMITSKSAPVVLDEGIRVELTSSLLMVDG